MMQNAQPPLRSNDLLGVASKLQTPHRVAAIVTNNASVAPEFHILLADGWGRDGNGCAALRKPQFTHERFAKATVNSDDPLAIHSTAVYEVIVDASCARLCFVTPTAASAVDDDVASKVRVILKFGSKVIQARQFVLTVNVAELVEFARRLNLSGAKRAVAE